MLGGGSGGRGGRTGGSSAGANGGGASSGSGAAGGVGTGGSGGATGGAGGAHNPDGADDLAAAPDLAAGDAGPGDAGGDSPSMVYNCQALLAVPVRVDEWAKPAGAGQPGLTYKAINAAGDHIMDFSHAGYMGGGVASRPPVVQTPDPSGQTTPRPSRGPSTRVGPRAREWFPRRRAAGAGDLSGGGHHQHRRQRRGPARQRLGRRRHHHPLHRDAPPGVLHGGRRRAHRSTPAATATITDDYVPAGSSTFTVDNPAASSRWATR